MSVDITIRDNGWDQCWNMVRYSFTSTETRKLVRTDSPGRPSRLSHSSWTMWCTYWSQFVPTKCQRTSENIKLHIIIIMQTVPLWKTGRQVLDILESRLRLRPHAGIFILLLHSLPRLTEWTLSLHLDSYFILVFHTLASSVVNVY